MSPAPQDHPPTDRVVIDVVSDVICPWCYLGKRRLDKALAGLPREITPEVRWRPFLLDRSIPKSGIPRQEYLLKKFGPERVKDIHKPLAAAGAAEGIDYAFDRITVTPNTLDAHRLIRWADADGRQSKVVERLFQLYWLEGADIGDAHVLVKAAADCGMNADVVRQLLTSEADLDPVIAEINQAIRMGVTGVPTFIIAGRYAVPGAQSPEVLQDVILKAAAESA